MIRVGFKRPRAFASEGERQVDRIKKLIMSDLTAGLAQVQESILLTPVYTGRTLANYRWSLGDPVTEPRREVREPDLPGTTSGMPIGKEPRRRANAALVREEFADLLAELQRSKNPFQRIYLTNNTPYFMEVEYGTYSTSEGSQTRTPPGGMTRRGETILEATVLGLKRRGEGV